MFAARQFGVVPHDVDHGFDQAKANGLAVRGETPAGYRRFTPTDSPTNSPDECIGQGCDPVCCLFGSAQESDNLPERPAFSEGWRWLVWDGEGTGLDKGSRMAGIPGLSDGD